MGRQSIGDRRQAALEWNRRLDVCASNMECVCPDVAEKSVDEEPHVQPRGHSEWIFSPDSQEPGSSNGTRALQPWVCE